MPSTTSNVTSHHRGPQLVAPPGECYYNTVLCCSAIYGSLFYVANVVECGIARFLCAMRVFDDWASSSPPGYPCAKFSFFHDLHCWASPWRKIVYSVNHAVTHPAHMRPRKPNCLLFKMPQTCHLSTNSSLTTISIQQPWLCGQVWRVPVIMCSGRSSGRNSSNTRTAGKFSNRRVHELKEVYFKFLLSSSITSKHVCDTKI